MTTAKKIPENLFRSFLSRIPWDDTNYRLVTDSLKEKSIRIAGMDEGFLPVFLDNAVDRAPYIVTLLLQYYRERIHLPEEQGQLLLAKIRSIYQCEAAQAMETAPEEIPEQVCYALAFAMHTNDRPLYTAILRLFEGPSWMENLKKEEKGSLIGFFYRVFSMLRDSHRPLHTTARLCAAIFEVLGPELFKLLAIKLGSSHFRVEIMIEEQDSNDLRSMIAWALETDDTELLYALERIYRDLNLRHIGISDRELTRKVFCQQDTGGFQKSILLLEDMVGKKFAAPIEGIRRVSELIWEMNDSGNPVWEAYRHWYNIYFLGQKIQWDTENAQVYLSQFQPVQPVHNHIPFKIPVTKTVAAIIQGPIEALIARKKRLILEYLAVISPVNVYGEEIIRRNCYCTDSKSEINYWDVVPLLQAMGYSKNEIAEIYMRSHFRRLVPLMYFLRSLNEKGILGQKDNDNLDRVFMGCRFAATYNREFDSFAPAGLNVNFLQISPAWARRHPKFHQIMGAPENEGKEYIIRLGEFRTDTGRCMVFPEPDGSIVEGTGNADSDLDVLLDGLRQVEAAGELTTHMNQELCALPRIDGNIDPHDGKIMELSVQYLKCCAAIARREEEQSSREGSNLRYFINMINSAHFCIRNPYKYNSSGAACEVFRYPQEIFHQVLSCWRELTAADCSIGELFFVYINTALKHCISFSSLMNCYCSYDSGPVRMEELLGKYTNYWFSGKVVRNDPGNRSIEIRPSEINTYNKFGADRYVYTLPTDGRVYFKMDDYRFRIESYERRTQTFYLSALKRPHERDTIPTQTFSAALSNAAQRRELYVTDVRDLWVDDLQQGDKLALASVTSMVDALVLRQGDSTALQEYMALLYKNNPWKFSRKKLPGLRVNDTLQSKTENLVLSLMGEDPELVIKIYFNSPLRMIVPLNRLLENSRESDADQQIFLKQLQRYPLEIQNGQPQNFVVDHYDAYADGTYTIQSTGYPLKLKSSPHMSIPADFSRKDAEKAAARIGTYGREMTGSILLKAARTGVLETSELYRLRPYMDFADLTLSQQMDLGLGILEAAIAMAEIGNDVRPALKEFDNIAIRRTRMSLNEMLVNMNRNRDVFSVQQYDRLRALGARFRNCRVPAQQLYDFYAKTPLLLEIFLWEILDKAAEAESETRFSFKFSGTFRKEGDDVVICTDNFRYDHEREKIVVLGQEEMSGHIGKTFGMRVISYDRSRRIYECKFLSHSPRGMGAVE